MIGPQAVSKLRQGAFVVFRGSSGERYAINRSGQLQNLELGKIYCVLPLAADLPQADVVHELILWCRFCADAVEKKAKVIGRLHPTRSKRVRRGILLLSLLAFTANLIGILKVTSPPLLGALTLADLILFLFAFGSLLFSSLTGKAEYYEPFCERKDRSASGHRPEQAPTPRS